MQFHKASKLSRVKSRSLTVRYCEQLYKFCLTCYTLFRDTYVELIFADLCHKLQHSKAAVWGKNLTTRLNHFACLGTVPHLPETLSNIPHPATGVRVY
jgi:hypothetical protein